MHDSGVTNESNPPYVIVWRLTEACDLDCKFCTYARSNHFKRGTLRQNEVIRFSELIANWARQEHKELLVSWLGGEPFLWKGLLETSELLRTHDIRVSVTTNGKLFSGTKYTPSAAVRAFDEITFSIDGQRASHDKSRGVPGLYQALLSKAVDIQSFADRVGRELILRANVLVYKNSLNEFSDIVRDCISAGITQITFNALWVPPHHELSALRLSPEDLDQFTELVEGLREEFDGYCQILGSKRYLSRLRQYAADIHSLIRDCHPGSRTLFVESNGQVSPCAYTSREYGVPIESITSLIELARLIPRYRMQRSLLLAPACHDCPDTNVFGKFDL